MKRREFCVLAASLATPAVSLAAVRGDEAMYVGGTMTNIPEKSDGRLDLSSESEAKFTSKKGEFSIPYKKISSLEYGQKAGRRVGVSLAVSPLFLLSKKRKHFLTIGFSDQSDKNQGVVFEIAKGKVQSIISVFETRSGKKVEYESEEARKHVNG